MRKGRFLLIALFLLAPFGLRAQEVVRFGQYTVVLEQNVLQTPAKRTRGAGSGQSSLELGLPANGRVNVLMQFAKVPDAKALAKLSKRGVKLEGYVGGNTYYAQVLPGKRPQDFAGCNATSVMAMRPEWKVSSLLAEGSVPQWADRGNGRVEVRLSWFSNVDAAYAAERVGALEGCRVLSSAERFASMRVEMPLAQVKKLAAMPWVQRVSPVEPPQEVNDVRGTMLSTGSVLAQPVSLGGRGLTGKGVKIGLWDEDVTRHVDLGDRVHILEAEQGTPTGHGHHTAGIIAGNGLLDPAARGVAPEAELYTMNFNVGRNGKVPEQEMVEVADTYNISLSSNSYGITYGYLCGKDSLLSYSFGSAYNQDLITNWLPELTLIYSAGNSQSDCPGHQYGSSVNRSKNAIHVGAIDEEGGMTNFSSWGPMDDGRLLPTVSAKGLHVYSMMPENGHDYMDGTSMACPMVTGHAALLTQRYHQLNGGANPSSALLKGLLANTAVDRGNPGPDYSYGYGIVNAEAAVVALENGWYKLDTMQSGMSKPPITIEVPAGVKQLRVMLTWIDPVVDKEYAYGEPALVNDLDLSVSQGGAPVQPWVLDRGNPEKPATRGMDAINNIEQVVIDNPEAGTATVTIGGQDKIKDNNGEEGQAYVVTWYFDYGQPKLLHPLGGEVFSPSDTILLRTEWLVGETMAEISYDDGKTYSYLGKVNEVFSTPLLFPKDAPATSKARVRVTDSKGHVLVNAKPFTLAPAPQEVTYSAEMCNLGSWRLEWEGESRVTKYEVLQADVPTGKWSVLGETSLTSYSIPKEKIVKGGRNVFAVRAKLADGAVGPRSLGVLVEEGTPLTIKKDDLPFRETFTMLPPPSATLQWGGNITPWSTPTFADFKMPVGSQIYIAQAMEDATSSIPFKDRNNTLKISLCDVDLSGVPASSDLVFHSIVMADEGTQVRLLVNGSQVNLMSGEAEYTGTTGLSTDLYWSLKEVAGKPNVKMELQVSCPEAGSLVGIVAYGVEIASKDPDVLVFMLSDAVAPKKNMGVETLPVSIVNQSASTVPSVQLVVTVDSVAKVVKVVEDLKPFEDRVVRVDMDFSTNDPLGHLFEVEAEARLKGDVDVTNNADNTEVYNMGDVSLHPATAKESGFFKDPKVTVKVDKPVLYTDEGGAHRGYGPGVGGIQYSSVHFVPSDPSKVVEIEFRDWDIDEGAAVGVFAKDLAEAFNYDDEVETFAVAGKRGSQETPRVATSMAEDGGLYVFFIGKPTRPAAGWMAEVRQVAKTNYFTLSKVTTETNRQDTAAVSVVLKNNVNEQRQVNVDVAIEGEEYPESFTIPVVAAGSEATYKIGNINAPAPSYRQIEVTVRGNDRDFTDNTQTAFVGNDSYPFWGQFDVVDLVNMVRASAGASSVELSSVEPHWLVSYQLGKELSLYAGKNDLRVELSEAPIADMLPAALHVWVDADGNGQFDEAKEHFETALAEGQSRYDVLVDLSGAAAGAQRMRVALIPDKQKDDFFNGKVAEWGQMIDITAKVIVGANPAAKDLAVAAFEPIPSGVNLGQQPVQATIVNNGVEAEQNVEVTLEVFENGGSAAAQTIKGTVATIAGVGGTAACDFGGQKVDLSKAGTAYTLRVSVPEDGVAENNSLTQEVVSALLPVADKKYALDFKKVKGEGLDFARLGLETRLGEASTLEGWFYLRDAQLATLLESDGLWVAATGNGEGNIPRNGLALVVGVGEDALTYISGPEVLKPGQYHHVAIALQKPQSYFGSQVDLYVDGQMQTLKKVGYGSYAAPDFTKMVGAVAFNGQVAMVRMWSKTLKKEEVQANKDKSVRQANGTLPADCEAEFMMNEGRWGYTASGSDLAKIESERGDSVWTDLRLLRSITLKGQEGETTWTKGGDTLVVEMPGQVVGAAMRGTVESVATLWPGTVVTTGATKVEKESSLMFSKQVVTLEAKCKVLGVDVTQTAVVRLKTARLSEAKLTNLAMNRADNANLKRDVSQTVDGQTVLLAGVENQSGTETVDLTAAKLVVTISDGAHLEYGNQRVKTGETITVDLTSTALLKVVSENGRFVNCYSVELQIQKQPQTIKSWEVLAASYVFTNQTYQLKAESSSGQPVVFYSEDADVVTVDSEGKLRTAGIGKTNVVASVPASDRYEAAEVQKRSVEVTPAQLTIRPAKIEIEEGEEPWLDLEYTGRQFNESPAAFTKTPEYAIYLANGEEWDANMGPLAPGSYPVKPLNYSAPYADGNYIVTAEEGTLFVKPSAKNKRVIFTVKDAENAPLEEAIVAIDGAELTTDATGKTSIVLAPGSYDYVVTLKDYTKAEGEVTVTDADQDVPVSLAKLEVTITYEAGAHGAIGGEAVQRLSKGAMTKSVTAAPEVGYEFDKWDDDPTKGATRSDKAETDKSYTASFKVKMYTLTYEVGEGGELVSNADTQKQEGQLGADGKEVEVKAKAGYVFVGWSDGKLDAKRRDKIEDRTLTAHFEMAFKLPLVENFNGLTEMPAHWRVENYSTEDAAVWMVGDDPKYMPNESAAEKPCMRIRPVFFTETNAAAVTPWLSLENHTGDLTVSFKVYHTTGSLTLQYRDGVTSEWKTIKDVPESSQGVALSASIPESTLIGKTTLQFRWVYEMPEHSLGSAVDDIAIGVTSTQSFKVVYTAGANGKVTLKPTDPSQAQESVTVTKPNTSVTAVADTDYEFAQWSDGNTQATRRDGTSGEFTASFRVKVRVVSLQYAAGKGGYITGSSYQKDVKVGSDGESVTAVPEKGYHFVQWSDGVTENPRTDKQVQKDVNVTAEFAINVYTLTYNAGEHGTIAENGTQKVEHGKDGKPVEVKANPGYHFVQWSDGVKENPRTDKQVQKDVKATAEFAINVYTLTYNAGEHGTIAENGTQKVEHGKDGKPVEVKANPGYHFVQWSDGVKENPRTDKQVTGDKTVTAEYEKDNTQPTTATLAFVVSDANGFVEGASVEIEGVAGEKKTDANGEAKFEGLTVGTEYSYTVSKNGYTPKGDKVTLTADLPPVEVTLEKSAPQPTTVILTFEVKDEAGQAVQDATVQIANLEKKTDGAGVAKCEIELSNKETSYVVMKTGYKKYTRFVTPTSNQTISVQLEREATPVESVALSVVALRPNPASTILLVDNAAEVERVSVISLRGVTLLRQENAGGEATVRIDVTSLAEGMYLLRVEAAGMSRAIPFAVER